jgi:hypothetical protein
MKKTMAFRKVMFLAATMTITPSSENSGNTSRCARGGTIRANRIGECEDRVAVPDTLDGVVNHSRSRVNVIRLEVEGRPGSPDLDFTAHRASAWCQKLDERSEIAVVSAGASIAGHC